ncbi:unnamed protein product, partial [Brassica oleracea]
MYYHFNHARETGFGLISPDDFVMVIQNKSHSNEEVLILFSLLLPFF